MSTPKVRAAGVSKGRKRKTSALQKGFKVPGDELDSLVTTKRKSTVAHAQENENPNNVTEESIISKKEKTKNKTSKNKTQEKKTGPRKKVDKSFNADKGNAKPEKTRKSKGKTKVDKGINSTKAKESDITIKRTTRRQSLFNEQQELLAKQRQQQIEYERQQQQERKVIEENEIKKTQEEHDNRQREELENREREREREEQENREREREQREQESREREEQENRKREEQEKREREEQENREREEQENREREEQENRKREEQENRKREEQENREREEQENREQEEQENREREEQENREREEQENREREEQENREREEQENREREEQENREREEQENREREEQENREREEQENRKREKQEKREQEKQEKREQEEAAHRELETHREREITSQKVLNNEEMEQVQEYETTEMEVEGENQGEIEAEVNASIIPQMDENDNLIGAAMDVEKDEELEELQQLQLNKQKFKSTLSEMKNTEVFSRNKHLATIVDQQENVSSQVLGFDNGQSEQTQRETTQAENFGTPPGEATPERDNAILEMIENHTHSLQQTRYHTPFVKSRTENDEKTLTTSTTKDTNKASTPLIQCLQFSRNRQDSIGANKKKSKASPGKLQTLVFKDVTNLKQIASKKDCNEKKTKENDLLENVVINKLKKISSQDPDSLYYLNSIMKNILEIESTSSRTFLFTKMQKLSDEILNTKCTGFDEQDELWETRHADLCLESSRILLQSLQNNS